MCIRDSWKDYNFNLKYQRRLKNIQFSLDMFYIRSLNYQWELDDFASPYYHPGNDVNNFHLNLKLTYLIPLAN